MPHCDQQAGSVGRQAARSALVCAPLCPAPERHRGRPVPRLIFLFLLILAPCVQATPTGRVLRVIDGDTVVVLTQPERTVRVRLAGIDAPEKGQPFGQRARQFLALRVAGRVVEMAGDSRDHHDRILGTQWADGRDINLSWSVAAWPGRTVSGMWR
ncbi:hypothetical protein F6B50_19695 [Salmonella enterica]|nr:hypothetical protein [Salmonella enterica]EDC7605724.1 hypothetical protein [Salmonella enterica subsp. enterica serovar Newport]ECX3817974.1 hypothetical protein [Salmonella enterica]ECY2497504.1 hypothetical protein [Salmonella enterica]ECY2524420.1 hypothetical protein [Salmonella enterica]